jgi:NDP-sugar pyrophosphorylase family protein
MQCVILAGGLGTRMRPHTHTLPKAMLPVNGVPFVDHQLTLLAGQGVSQVVFCVGYRGDMISDFVGDGGRWGLAADYVDEGKDLKGTAGALRVALDAGRLEEDFLVLYGDSYLPIDHPPVMAAFLDSGADALMTVFRNGNRWDTSNVLFEDGRIVVYDKHRRDPRSAEMMHIDYGLGAFRRSTVDKYVPPDVKADLADVYQTLCSNGLLAGYEVSSRFFEVGSPGGLSDLEAHLTTIGRRPR